MIAICVFRWLVSFRLAIAPYKVLVEYQHKQHPVRLVADRNIIGKPCCGEIKTGSPNKTIKMSFSERSRHEKIDYNALDFEEDIEHDGKCFRGILFMYSISLAWITDDNVVLEGGGVVKVVDGFNHQIIFLCFVLCRKLLGVNIIKKSTHPSVCSLQCECYRLFIFLTITVLIIPIRLRVPYYTVELKFKLLFSF